MEKHEFLKKYIRVFIYVKKSFDTVFLMGIYIQSKDTYGLSILNRNFFLVRNKMNKDEVKAKLKGFFESNLGVDGSILKDDTPLFGEEIGLDSVDSLEIISFVDDEFGVSMTGVAKENFLSIESISSFIVANA